MADAMVMRDDDVGRIVEYVKPWLRELVQEMAPRREPDDLSPQLLERMVRVEEELKGVTEVLVVHTEQLRTQGETLKVHTEQLKSQGETLRDHSEELRAQREMLATQRELMDERFAFTKERFEMIDKRFTTLTWMIGAGFALLTSLTTVFALLT